MDIAHVTQGGESGDIAQKIWPSIVQQPWNLRLPKWPIRGENQVVTKTQQEIMKPFLKKKTLRRISSLDASCWIAGNSHLVTAQSPTSQPLYPSVEGCRIPILSWGLQHCNTCSKLQSKYAKFQWFYVILLYKPVFPWESKPVWVYHFHCPEIKDGLLGTWSAVLWTWNFDPQMGISISNESQEMVDRPAMFEYQRASQYVNQFHFSGGIPDETALFLWSGPSTICRCVMMCVDLEEDTGKCPWSPWLLLVYERDIWRYLGHFRGQLRSSSELLGKSPTVPWRVERVRTSTCTGPESQ